MNKEKFLKLFGNNVKNLRISKQYTQERLANEINVTRGIVANIERGVAFAKADTLVNLCNVLDCKISDLFDF